MADASTATTWGRTMPTDDLSPEQQITRALVAHQYGDAEADRIVREDRVEAYRIGAFLAPPLREMASLLARAIATYNGSSEAKP